MNKIETACAFWYRMTTALFALALVGAVHAQNGMLPQEGAFSGKSPAGDKMGELGAAVKLYPNPFNDVLYLEIPTMTDRWIYIDLIEPNANNTIQLSASYSNLISFNTSQVPPGNYIVKVKGGSGAYYGQFKAIKSRN
ncbi:MAG: T9SS type A sorting domain-containing protein [Flavobacteriales bacterium]|nr:T9SS type A sorting domain-containing protein [Flavobacteriales bacterium]